MAGKFFEINWGLLGAEVAQQNGEIQTEFFKAFVKECHSWGTHFQIETQLLDINQNLTPHEREILSILSYQEKGV